MAGQVLRRLTDECPWMRAWTEGLRRFLRTGGRLVLLPGNHDLEWYHPHTDAAWRDLLGDEAGGFEIWREPGPWQARTGDWEIVVSHGHRGDVLNDCDPAKIHDALRRGRESLPLPPGSQFVLHSAMAFKRAVDPHSGRPRFRFLDAVKPEPALLGLLLALDSRMFFDSLPGGLKLKAEEIIRSVVRDLRGGPVLAAASSAEPAPDVIRLLAAELVRGMDDGISAEAAEVELETFFSGAPPPFAGTLGAGGGRVRRWLARAWLRRQREAAAAFLDPDALSTADEAVIREWLPPSLAAEHRRAIVCGHTHAARHWQRPGTQHHYLNTGTWSRLMDVSRFAETPEGLDELLVLLEKDAPPLFERLTWAEITPRGPSLHEWV